jgi:hypothetical protein
MLKIPAEYERDTSSAKFKGISSQLRASLLGVCAETKELWWMNQEWLQLRWGGTVDQKLAAVRETFYTKPPLNSKQQPAGARLVYYNNPTK